jgi:hypothetical protein
MNKALEFECREADRARLDGLESVLAAIVDLLASSDPRLQEAILHRLALLQVMMREENAHSESLAVVGRFGILVADEEDVSRTPALAR